MNVAHAGATSPHAGGRRADSRPPGFSDTASPRAARRCDWCGVASAAATGRFCSKKCRQTAWRLRHRRGISSVAARGATFVYADPPYIGLARRYYGDQPSYAGEVDHRALIASLEAGNHCGWALSASAASLRELLPLCPPGARVCPWVKQSHVPRATIGLHNSWEPLIVVRGRPRRPGVADFLFAKPARGGGDLPGRKPLAFCVWLFELLGMLAGDQLVDLFPGTGIVGRSWAEISRVASTPEAS